MKIKRMAEALSSNPKNKKVIRLKRIMPYQKRNFKSNNKIKGQLTKSKIPSYRPVQETRTMEKSKIFGTSLQGNHKLGQKISVRD